MARDKIEIDWADCIVIFNSLIESIEALRNKIEDDRLNDDELYDAEETLNDYVTLISRLKIKYKECPDKGELPKELIKKLESIA